MTNPPVVSSILKSATMQLAIVFLAVAVALVILDWLLLYFTGQGLRYLPELFGVLMAPMFLGIAGKAGLDNFIGYRERTTTAVITGLGAPPR